MMLQTRFVHVNLIAEDWRRLARFYVDVFGCVPAPPERRLGGQRLAAATGVPDAELRGVHLRLPGFDAEGLTLEVSEYSEVLSSPPVAPNQRGLGHIAFAVDDVEVVQNALLAAGGSSVGELVSLAISTTRCVTFAYARDPEGNIIELQRWSTLGGVEAEGSNP